MALTRFRPVAAVVTTRQAAQERPTRRAETTTDKLVLFGRKSRGRCNRKPSRAKYRIFRYAYPPGARSGPQYCRRSRETRSASGRAAPQLWTNDG